MITEFVVLCAGPSWLSQVSETDLKLRSYLFLTKCLSFSDHLSTPDIWHHLLGSSGTGSRVKQPQLHSALLFGHRRQRCTCPILISASDLKETTLMVHGAWYSSAITCLCLYQQSGIREHPVLPSVSFTSTDLFPVKEWIPRVDSQLG